MKQQDQNQNYPSEAQVAPYSIFEQMPDVIFFVKNANRQFERANPTFARLCGARYPQDLKGRMSSEFFAADVAEIYNCWDAELLSSGQTMLSQFHKTKNSRGKTRWLFGTRMVCQAQNDEGLKIVSHSRLMPKFRNSNRIYTRIKSATDRLADFSAPAPTSDELATISQCSVAQLGRDFIHFFGLSPHAYLIELRIQRAKDLIRSGMTLAEVALACGYSDQPSLTRSFKKTVGLTPGEFALSL